MLAPEIIGSKCKECGSALERTTAGIWCDFCCEIQGDNVGEEEEVLTELIYLFALNDIGDEVRERAITELRNFSMRAYDIGYDEGRSEGESDCDGDYEW